MTTYILRRILAMIPALLGISLITFVLMHSTKGGPFDSERPNDQIKASLMRAYGLDQPQWATFLGPGPEVWRTATLIVLGLGLAVLALAIFLQLRKIASDTLVRPALFTTGIVLLVWQALMVIQSPGSQGWWLLVLPLGLALCGLAIFVGQEITFRFLLVTIGIIFLLWHIGSIVTLPNFQVPWLFLPVLAAAFTGLIFFIERGVVLKLLLALPVLVLVTLYGLIISAPNRTLALATLVLAVSSFVAALFLDTTKLAPIRVFRPIPTVAGAILAIWYASLIWQAPSTSDVAGFVPGQFLRFLWNLTHGDLGPSLTQRGRGVTEILVSAAGNSFVLGVTAFAILIGLALPLGVIAALKQNTWIDYVASMISLVGYSIPNFVLGVVLILVIGLQLGWLPIAGWAGPQYVIMPAFVLAIRPVAVLTRLTRASMLEVLNQDYIRTAWAKGLPGRIVVVRHALRNALLPVVTVLGDQLGDLVTGSLVIETLFNVNGVGQWFVESVARRDYGMIMGTTVFYATLVLAINLVVDLLYGVIDPRVRLGGEARS